MEASNNDLEEKLRGKRVTLWSALVILDQEPSHLAGKKPIGQEARIKKSWKHAKNRYKREEDCMDTEGGYHINQENIYDRYQPSTEKNRSLINEDSRGKIED